MHPYPHNQSQFISQSFSRSTGVGIFYPAACLLLETVYIEKTLEEGKKKWNCPPLPKTPQNAQKRCEENMGEGGPGSYFKTWSLFAIGNRNKQTTETNDKELFHECNIEKGKKFLLGGQPIFLFVNYFSCSCLLKLPLQFNKPSSKTNKTPWLQKSPVLGKVLYLRTGAPLWGCSDSQTHTPHTLTNSVWICLP